MVTEESGRLSGRKRLKKRVKEKGERPQAFSF